MMNKGLTWLLNVLDASRQENLAVFFAQILNTVNNIYNIK